MKRSWSTQLAKRTVLCSSKNRSNRWNEGSCRMGSRSRNRTSPSRGLRMNTTRTRRCSGPPCWGQWTEGYSTGNSAGFQMAVVSRLIWSYPTERVALGRCPALRGLISRSLGPAAVSTSSTCAQPHSTPQASTTFTPYRTTSSISLVSRTRSCRVYTTPYVSGTHSFSATHASLTTWCPLRVTKFSTYWGPVSSSCTTMESLSTPHNVGVRITSLNDSSNCRWPQTRRTPSLPAEERGFITTAARSGVGGTSMGGTCSGALATQEYTAATPACARATCMLPLSRRLQNVSTLLPGTPSSRASTSLSSAELSPASGIAATGLHPTSSFRTSSATSRHAAA
mmetsp:Transcript_38646/g.101002  ORF Transcript_38646/g.101002 Transcript_38646/m.101002 type:complete len:339 (-) Transcript_38646:418-1434(-)